MRIFGILLAALCLPLFAADAPAGDDEALIAPAPRTGVIKSVTMQGADLKIKLYTRAGQQFDQSKLRKDVQALWSTGFYEDIKVQTKDEEGGTSVVFQVTPKTEIFLRDIRVEPHSFGINPTLSPGVPMDPLRANQVALQVQRKLVDRGYVDAVVEPEIIPVGKNKIDLKLHVTAGEPIRVKSVEIVGDTAFSTKEVSKALQALRSKKILPAIPGIFRGYTMRPAYSEDAVQSDLARLQSFYLSRGYFDARVSLDNAEVKREDASLRLFVNSGPHYKIKQLEIFGKGVESKIESPKDGLFAPTALCACLFKARREAELRGVVDFNAKLNFHPVESVPGQDPTGDLTAQVDSGRSYTVGKIELRGLHHYSEANVRRNFLINEADLLDQTLLRKSIARLNQTQMFEPFDETQIAINTDDSTGTADIIIPLHEKKRGIWNLSGPVGPISLAGPLNFMVGSRLPPWGKGVLELSTYYLSFSLIGYAHAITAVLPGSFNKAGILPVISLFRPFTPGEGWKSGFVIAPQLGWQTSLYSYGTTQVTQRLLPLIMGDSRYVSQLAVTFERPGGDGVMLCQPPKPKFYGLRMAAAFTLQLAGAVSSGL